MALTKFDRIVQCCAVVVLMLSGSFSLSPHAQSSTLVFEDQRESSTGAPRTIVSADFNGDSYADVALGGTGRDAIAIHFNVATGAIGRFRTPAREVVVGGGPFDLAAGDLNRDGRIDIAVANADLDAVTILLNDAANSFATVIHVPVSQNPRGLAIGDFNGDGIPDIVVTKYMGTTMDVLYGAGDGTFPTRRSYAAPAYSQGVVAAHLDPDGWMDAALVSASGVVSVYRMFPNTGTAARRDYSRPYGGNVITTGDFNRDGWLDVAYASSTSSVVEVMYRTADGTYEGTWAPVGEAIPVAASPRGIEAGDINQDGHLDIVVAGRAASMVTVLTGSSSGSYARTDVPAGTGARDVALGDYRRDGALDVATADEYGNSATVLANTTNFGPRPAFRFEALPVPGSYDNSVYDVADFNRNGILDLVKRNYVMLDGTTKSATLRWWNGASASTGAAGDFNGDGVLDVVYTDQKALRPFLGNGRGGFSNWVGTGTGTLTPFLIRSADMNRDGFMDIVALLSDFNSTGALQIFVNRGDGVFDDGPIVAVSQHARVLDIGDVNRDGKLDVVVPDRDGVHTFLGDGAGGLAAAAVFEEGVARYGVSLGDVTSDGILDMVTTDMNVDSWGASWGPRITVARGNGDGMFERIAQHDLEDPGYVYTVLLADLTNDGRLDIFSSNGHFLRGVGDGTFLAPRRFSPGSFIDYHAADFNRDGLTDLIGFQDYANGGGEIIMLNTRTPESENRPPTGLTERESVNWNYADYWYAEEESGIYAGFQIRDPDLHAVRYRWTVEGRVVSTWESYTPGPEMTPGSYEVTITIDDYNGASVSDTFTLNITPHKETVLHGWQANVFGAWQKVEDPTAAGYQYGGQIRLHHPNANAPKLQAPLANPTDYVEFGFLADPTQEYKLWIRLKADNDHWANDSVFVQFTGAKDAAGNPIYELGTTSALAVNLEECSGCGVSGWGWEDDGWGAVNRNGVTVRFPEGGRQIIRIQTREDGVSLDQVVLSSEKYLTTRPGAAKNDTTKLPQMGPEIGTWWYYNQ